MLGAIGNLSSGGGSINYKLYKTQIIKEVHDKHKKYGIIYLKFLATGSIFIAIYFGVRAFVRDESISKFIIFPLFIAALFIMIKLSKKMIQLRKDIQSIKPRINAEEAD